MSENLKSWEPSKGEPYYTFTSGYLDISLEYWNDFPIDYLRKKCGMVFKTKEEAEKVRPETYKQLLQMWRENI